MTTTALIVAVAIAVLGSLLALLKHKLGPQRPAAADGPWPYVVHPVMSAPEQIVFHRLVAALPDHVVLAQVQVSRVLRVDERRPDEVSWRNRVSQLSFDFLVCGKDAQPVLAIEVDDATHDRASRRKADQKKDRACHDAGLRIVRWRVNKLPDEAGIRAAMGVGTPVPDGANAVLQDA